MANNQGIANSWSLVSFAQAKGAPKYVPSREFTNTKTGEVFNRASLAFVHPTEKDEQGRAKATFVAFSSNLGELSPSEVVSRKDDLQVVELADSHSFILCARGEGNWMDLNFGI